MKRGTDVCIGIKRVKQLDDSNAEIVSFKLSRSQLLLIGVNQINNGSDCIGNDDEIHQLFKSGHIEKSRIQMNTQKEYKPEVIRKNEKFAKGYFAVKRGFNRVVCKGKHAL